MTGVRIRAAVADDAEALIRAIAAAYSVYASRNLDLPPVSEGVADDIAVHSVWVAELNGSVVGGLSLVVGDDGHAHLANVAVRPDCAGQGIGRALIVRAEAQCRSRGVRELSLTTHVGLPENVRFYERLGWSETERTGTKVHMSKHL
jgi:GNAT superfamily N-acetyltransferase